MFLLLRFGSVYFEHVFVKNDLFASQGNVATFKQRSMFLLLRFGSVYFEHVFVKNDLFTSQGIVATFMSTISVLLQ